MMTYPLTAPAVRPATILRWKMRTRTMSGSVTMTEAAMMLPQGNSCWLAPVIERDGDRHRALLVGEREGEREQELVPGGDEGEEARSSPAPATSAAGRRGARRSRARAVDESRLLQFARQFAHEGGEHPHREGQCEDQVCEHQAGQASCRGRCRGSARTCPTAPRPAGTSRPRGSSSRAAPRPRKCTRPRA